MQTIMGNLFKLCPGIGNSTTGSTQSKSRPYNCRKPYHIFCKVQGLFIISYNLRRNARLAYRLHCILKHLPVFCLINRKRTGSQKLNPVTFQKARFCKLHAKGQTGLSPQSRKQGIRFFFFDNSFKSLKSKRFKIYFIGHGMVGHEGCRVRVYKTNLKSKRL